MALFGLGKKKDCCCSGNCVTESMEIAIENNKSGESVKVLGSGCEKCNQLEANRIEDDV